MPPINILIKYLFLTSDYPCGALLTFTHLSFYLGRGGEQHKHEIRWRVPRDRTWYWRLDQSSQTGHGPGWLCPYFILRVPPLRKAWLVRTILAWFSLAKYLSQEASSLDSYFIINVIGPISKNINNQFMQPSYWSLAKF